MILSLIIFILGSIFLLSQFSNAKIMVKTCLLWVVWGQISTSIVYWCIYYKFGKARDGKVGEAVQEVIIRDMCNYNTNTNTIPTNTEFKISNHIEIWLLWAPLSEVGIVSLQDTASCVTEVLREWGPECFYLLRRIQPCSHRNTSAKEISECYKVKVTMASMIKKD